MLSISHFRENILFDLTENIIILQNRAEMFWAEIQAKIKLREAYHFLGMSTTFCEALLCKMILLFNSVLKCI